ncbi:LysR family transcriptional regulator, partial [Streptomyces sp. adm13(2018)]
LVTRPLAGTPLLWRHLLGWHPEGRAAARSAAVLDHTRAAHAEALATSAGRRHTGAAPRA